MKYEKWAQWNVTNRDYLVREQSKEGHEKGSWYFGRSHFKEVGGSVSERLKALSWSNLLFGMRAYIQRDHLMVVFLEVVVQLVYAASTARQHSRGSVSPPW